MMTDAELDHIAKLAEDAKFAKANIENRRAGAASWAKVEAYEKRVTPSTVLALVEEIRVLKPKP
jgi:hypothetical protein